jgi:sterol 14-demethylase
MPTASMVSNLLFVLGTPQTWLSSVLVLAATICVLLCRLVSRPAWPPKAPKYLPGWPVIGSPGFFGDRWSFLKEGYSRSPFGQFSFFYGPHPIVALSGSAGRQTFYNSRSLDMNEG